MLLSPSIVTREECFFQPPGQNLSSGIDIQFVFITTPLYLQEVCYMAAQLITANSVAWPWTLLVLVKCLTWSTPMMVMTTQHQTFPLTDFTYPHLKVIFQSLASLSMVNILWILGLILVKHFQISVIAVGQKDGAVPSTLISTIKNNNLGSNLQDSQYLQQVNNTCTNLN